MFHSATLRSLFRLTGFLLATLIAMPIQALAIVRPGRFAEEFPIFYHRIICLILGFRIEIRGTISTDRPTLFVSNHTSYLDIEILGSAIRGSFVAKSEVAGWPLFGWLAKLQRSVFVVRKAATTAAQRDSMQGRLASGDNLILFPEGTSNDGNRVMPFKSALLSAASQRIDGRPITVQPVSLAYVRLNGMPIGRVLRPHFAWYGDMELAGHLWTVAGLGTTDVVLEFHEPITIDTFGSRKALSDHCFKVIAEAVSAANAGRPAAEMPVIRPPAPAGAVTVS
jgi:1-acyl-sn-glycerol-3-phosphate acyltransferase